MELYKHNQEAYDAIMEAFEAGHQRVAIVQATGTGKGVVGAKVCESFKKVMMLSPSEAIIEQNLRYNTDIEAHTYAWAMVQTTFGTDYDLIWLDEYHRAGAERWGEGIELLISLNPEAKLLGTTATDVRWLDGERNMSDEIFEGNVVHRLELGDCIDQGIFNIGEYVIGFRSFPIDETEIDRSDIDGEVKQNLKDEIQNKRIDWQNTFGIQGILARHLPKNTRGIVCFLDSIENVNVMDETISQWVKGATGKEVTTYRVTSDDRQALKRLKEFEEDEFDGIKIILSVNMANEGIHPDIVDAIIMLRSTASKNILLQQMGRAMTPFSNKRPTIFDIVDNITKANYIRELTEHIAVHTAHESYLRRDKMPFKIVDYTISIKELINRINNALYRHSRTYEECLAGAKLCKSYTEYRKRFFCEYRAAFDKGWIGNIVKEANLTKRLDESSFELIRDTAAGYEKLADFRKDHPDMEQYARHHGWLKQLGLKTRVVRYTDEALIAEGSKYATSSEFRAANSTMYSLVKGRGLLNKIFNNL